MPTLHSTSGDSYVPAYDRRDWLHEAVDEARFRKNALQILETVSPYLDVAVDQLCVLEVGSGYGETACELARVCREVAGIELSRQRVDAACQRARGDGLSNVRFECRSVYDLKQTASYDLAIMDNVLEHLADQCSALAAVSGAVKPGGVLYLLVPNKLWPIEVHYRLPFLSYLPPSWANLYLRVTGRGADYTDASYAPTYFRLKRLLEARTELKFQFVLPANIGLASGGASWHYRWGVRAIGACPFLWVISKALLVVATKRKSG